MTLATIRTSHLLMALSLMVVFVPNLTGAAIPSGWLFLLVVLPWFIWNRVEMGVTHWVALAFFAYALASLWWSPSPFDGVFTIATFLAIGMTFLFGQRCDLRSVIIGLGLGFIPSLVIGAIQWSKHDIGHDPVTGLFISQSLFGDIAALVLIVAMTQRLWWLVPVLAPAIVMAGTKSPYLVLCVGYVVWAWQNKRRDSAAIAVLFLVFAFTVTYAFGYRVSGSSLRVEIWERIIPNLTLFGHGAGSFEENFSSVIFSSSERTANAHNDFLQLTYEFGFAALPLLIALTPQLRSPVFAAFTILAFIQWPLEYPITAFIGALVAGVAYRERCDLRRLRLSSRSGLHASGRQCYA